MKAQLALNNVRCLEILPEIHLESNNTVQVSDAAVGSLKAAVSQRGSRCVADCFRLALCHSRFTLCR